MDKITAVPVDHIEVFRDRERDPEKFKMLCSSIAQYGLIEPLVVAPNNTGAKRKWRLIAGHGRLRAIKRLGLQKVQVVVRDDFQLTDFIIENWRRELSPHEAAVLVELELRMGKSKEDVARKFSISPRVIDEYVVVVRNLHPALQERVRTKKLSMRDAARIARKAPHPKAQETVVQAVLRAEQEKPSESVVKTVVSDILGAIKEKGGVSGLDSIEKLEKIRAEVADEYQGAKASLGIVRSHYILSYVELRRVLKEASVRAVMDKAGIEYKAVLSAE